MLMYLAKLVRVMPKISSRREVIYRKANAVTWPFNRTEGKVRLSTAPRQSLPDSTRHFNERALANKIKINLIRLARHFSRSVSVRHTRAEKEMPSSSRQLRGCFLLSDTRQSSPGFGLHSA
jgi:hypothetical protein